MGAGRCRPPVGTFPKTVKCWQEGLSEQAFCLASGNGHMAGHSNWDGYFKFKATARAWGMLTSPQTSAVRFLPGFLKPMIAAKMSNDSVFSPHCYSEVQLNVSAMSWRRKAALALAKQDWDVQAGLHRANLEWAPPFEDNPWHSVQGTWTTGCPDQHSQILNISLEFAFHVSEWSGNCVRHYPSDISPWAWKWLCNYLSISCVTLWPNT